MIIFDLETALLQQTKNLKLSKSYASKLKKINFMNIWFPNPSEPYQPNLGLLERPQKSSSKSYWFNKEVDNF